MGKRIVLIRHGKSDWADSSMTDFERPLNHRGHKNALEMAERLSRKGLVPELIVSSPAKRAITTAQHFSDIWHIAKNDIQQESTIYEANSTALLHVVSSLDDRFSFVSLFGHNPGLTDFTNFLADAHIYNIPTAGTVVIDFPFDSWAMVSYHTGELVSFDFPKNGDA